jgi:hypothetical protein
MRTAAWYYSEPACEPRNQASTPAAGTAVPRLTARTCASSRPLPRLAAACAGAAIAPDAAAYALCARVHDTAGGGNIPRQRSADVPQPQLRQRLFAQQLARMSADGADCATLCPAAHSGLRTSPPRSRGVIPTVRCILRLEEPQASKLQPAWLPRRPLLACLRQRRQLRTRLTAWTSR